MILDFYIGKKFGRLFVLSLLATVTIFLLAALIDLLNYDSDQPVKYLLLYLLFSTPNIILQSMPIALLLASVSTISGLAVSNELAVIYSAGRSFYRTIGSILLISIFCALFYFFAAEFTITQTNALAKKNKIYYTKGVDYSLYEQVQSRSLKGREGYYYFSSLDEEKEMIYDGFSYLQVGSAGEPRYFYDAERLFYRKRSDDWLLQNVKIVKFNHTAEIEMVTQREDLLLHLPEDIDFFKKPRSPQELGLFKLIDVIENLKRQGTAVNQHQVELHSRFSFPLICILLTFMGAIPNSRGISRSVNPLARSISISAAIIFIYYLGFSIGNSLGKVNLLHPATATWGPTAVFAAITLFLIWRYRR